MTNEELIQLIKSGKDIKDNTYLLYLQNMPLLKQWSKRYNELLGADDVLQECCIALYNAVKTFELEKGYKFTTYLQSAVKTHFSRISSKYSNTDISPNDKRLLMQYNALNEKEQQTAGHNISISKAANLLHCSEKDIQRISQYLSIQHCTSIDKPVSNGSDDDLNVIEVLPDKTNIEKDYEQQDGKEKLKQVWGYIGTICTDREQSLIYQHYKNNVSFRQLASCYSISLSRAEQIEKQAFKKIKNDKHFREWAKSFDYCTDISYHYGFNTWRNNRASAVELSTEIRERYTQWIATRAQREIEIKKRLAINELISKGLLSADCKYSIQT